MDQLNPRNTQEVVLKELDKLLEEARLVVGKLLAEGKWVGAR